MSACGRDRIGLDNITDEDGNPNDMFGDLEIEIEIAGDGVDEATLAQIKEWTWRSAVYNLMTLAHHPELTVRRKKLSAKAA